MRAIVGILALAHMPTVSAAAADPRPGEIIIRERLAPTSRVQTVAGNCGPHRYSIELRHDGSRNILSLAVDGRPVPIGEVTKVIQAVEPGYFMYEPSVVECFWDRPTARLRVVTDGPKSGGNPIWVSFEISPEGQVSAVRQD